MHSVVPPPPTTLPSTQPQSQTGAPDSTESRLHAPQSSVIAQTHVPASLRTNPDAIALRSALSILQIQRQHALNDIVALDEIRAAAASRPEEFIGELSDGRLKMGRGSADLFGEEIGGVRDDGKEIKRQRIEVEVEDVKMKDVEDEDDEEDEEEEEEEVEDDEEEEEAGEESGSGEDEDDEDEDEEEDEDDDDDDDDDEEDDDEEGDSEEAESEAESAGSASSTSSSPISEKPSIPKSNPLKPSTFPTIPTPQSVVRCPPINWAKYRILSHPLDAMHVRQQRRPDAGEVEGLGNSARLAAATAAESDVGNGTAEAVGTGSMAGEGGSEKTEPQRDVIAAPLKPFAGGDVIKGGVKGGRRRKKA